MSLQTRSDQFESKAPGPMNDQPSSWRFGLRQMLYLVFYCAIGCWLLAVVKAPVVAVIILVLVSLMTWFAIVVARRQSSQQQLLLNILSVALERDMPLAPALEAFADQFRGSYRRKVRSLAHVLNSGSPLPEALDCVPRILPGDAEVLARMGWESGMLPGAVRQATTLQGGLKSAWGGIISRIEYGLFLLIVVQVAGGFLYYFVVPKYQAILSDFRVTLPSVTIEVFRFSHLVSDYFPLIALLILTELALMIGLMASLHGWSRFSIPWIDRLFVRRHSALILRSLAWIVEGGLPLSRGLTMLADWYPTPWIRVLLNRSLQDVQHGTDWVESLRHHGLLGRADAAVLDSARRAGNLPWAMREAAEGTERRLGYRLQAIGHLLLPILVLALGSLVGLIAVAYFLPLIKILEVLAQ